MVHFLRCIDEKIFQRYVALDETFPKVYAACEQWLGKKD